MTSVRTRGRPSSGLIHWLAAAYLILNAAPAFAAQPIVVQLDHARLIKLPQRAATVVIGDPLVADLSIQPGGLAVITGKGYGTTNVIVLDRDGAVLAEQTIEVTAPGGPVVVVYHGDARQTYSCTPQCVSRITLGDST
jgi:Flp pilus assembly secretin CpaC